MSNKLNEQTTTSNSYCYIQTLLILYSLYEIMQQAIYYQINDQSINYNTNKGKINNQIQQKSTGTQYTHMQDRSNIQKAFIKLKMKLTIHS